ncbi:glycosyltransferase [Vibrio owensii]|uniref:glycosyltransferase family 4 protein n=1 Tax=Vibrio owensii TaxID=696485 RepID=UPI000EFB54BB|nr:glycosyltransferase family 4 protein [Vibrio owensii]AYO21202.1 glycosyltransferase [Vibrio owensii]
MVNKIVAFCGETFFKSDNVDGSYVAKPTSAAFLQDAFGEDNVYVVSPFFDKTISGKFSTEIKKEFFYKAPNYSSTKDFFINSVKQPVFLKNYIAFCDDIISQHRGDYFWIRTPSIGSIIFGLRALRQEEIVLHHMCADPSNTWKDTKYRGVDKTLAFLTSRFIRILLKRICSNPNTINLCTGDVLENYSRRYSKNTFQFVDVMIKESKTKKVLFEKDNDERMKLLFVGRMVEDKGIFDLIDVIFELKNNYKLKFVGDGPDFEKAREKVRLLGLEDSIEFTGQLPHKSLSEVFSNSDLIVVPSNNNYEGFPRVIMEAWSFNKPVVVSNVGGINAFVKDMDNGLIIKGGDKEDLKNALLKLVDVELYQQVCLGATKMEKKSTQKFWIDSLKKNIKESQ